MTIRSATCSPRSIRPPSDTATYPQFGDTYIGAELRGQADVRHTQNDT